MVYSKTIKKLGQNMVTPFPFDTVLLTVKFILSIITSKKIKLYQSWIDQFLPTVVGNIDILLTSESKLGETFPESQFLIFVFKKPIRLAGILIRGRIILSYLKEQTISQATSRFSWRENIFLRKHGSSVC